MEHKNIEKAPTITTNTQRFGRNFAARQISKVTCCATVQPPPAHAMSPDKICKHTSAPLLTRSLQILCDGDEYRFVHITAMAHLFECLKLCLSECEHIDLSGACKASSLHKTWKQSVLLSQHKSGRQQTTIQCLRTKAQAARSRCVQCENAGYNERWLRDLCSWGDHSAYLFHPIVVRNQITLPIAKANTRNSMP